MTRGQGWAVHYLPKGTKRCHPAVCFAVLLYSNIVQYGQVIAEAVENHQKRLTSAASISGIARKRSWSSVQALVELSVVGVVHYCSKLMHMGNEANKVVTVSALVFAWSVDARNQGVGTSRRGILPGPSFKFRRSWR